MNNQQINPTHVNALVESLSNQVKNLTLQLADSHGVIAVLQEQVNEFNKEPEVVED
jgi:hypothetical protein